MTHGEYRLTTKPSVVVSLIFMLVLLFVLVIATSLVASEEEGGNLTLAAICFAVGFFLFRALKIVRLNNIIKNRKQKILDRQIALGQFGENHSIPFGYSSLLELDRDDGVIVKNRAFNNFIRGEDYIYADYSYDEYRKTKNGDMLVRTHYYAVVHTTLSRKMPHVLFDSLLARKRQFRFVYSANQLHNLEGDFNKYFAVYFPRSYHIDSLSFVTPDVMWAMKEAADYDIEIVGDKLFMFGHQSNPDVQINDMAAKLAAIKKTLIRSVKAYRDERLPYASGKQSVAPLGVGLAKSLTKVYLWILLSVVLLCVGVFMFLMLDRALNYFLIIGASLFVSKVWVVRKELKHRKQLDQQMAKSAAGQQA